MARATTACSTRSRGCGGSREVNEAQRAEGAPRFWPPVDGYVIKADQYELWRQGRGRSAGDADRRQSRAGPHPPSGQVEGARRLLHLAPR